MQAKEARRHAENRQGEIEASQKRREEELKRIQEMSDDEFVRHQYKEIYPFWGSMIESNARAGNFEVIYPYPDSDALFNRLKSALKKKGYTVTEYHDRQNGLSMRWTKVAW